MMVPVSMVCVPLWLAIVLTACAVAALCGWAAALVGIRRARAVAAREEVWWRNEVKGLRAEVMKLEARSRGVGGTGAHGAPIVSPLFPPLAR